MPKKKPDPARTRGRPRPPRPPAQETYSFAEMYRRMEAARRPPFVFRERTDPPALRPGEWIRFGPGNTPHEVAYVTACAAYVRPAAGGETLAIAVHSLVPRMENPMKLKQLTAAVTALIHDTLITPNRDRLGEWYATHAAEFPANAEAEQDSPGVFSNWLSDLVFDQVYEVVSNVKGHKNTPATAKAAAQEKPAPALALVTKKATPPETKVPQATTRVLLKDGRAYDKSGHRILAFEQDTKAGKHLIQVQTGPTATAWFSVPAADLDTLRDAWREAKAGDVKNLEMPTAHQVRVAEKAAKAEKLVTPIPKVKVTKKATAKAAAMPRAKVIKAKARR